MSSKEMGLPEKNQDSEGTRGDENAEKKLHLTAETSVLGERRT